MEEKKQSFNLKRELTNKDMEIIRKLEYEIHDGLYDENSYERLKENLGIYRSYHNEDPQRKYKKPLKYGVKKREFDNLCNKFKEIDNKYNKCLNNARRKIGFEEIWFTDKQHVRDKLMIALKQKTLNNTQKKKVLEIITNMKNVSIKQKERFIMYYGLDNKIYNCKEIAKKQNCTSSNIRQAIRTVTMKIIRLSDEEIDRIRKILKIKEKGKS